MTSERAVDGREELRREIEALVRYQFEEEMMSGRWRDMIDRAAVLAIVDRLAAARGEPEPALPLGHPDTWPGGTMHMSQEECGINVERLARALTTVYEEDLFPIKSGDWRYDASLIAAEYAALATPTTPEPDQ